MPNRCDGGRAVEQMNFRLPSYLVDLIRAEAAERRIYGRDVLVERLGESFRLSPPTLTSIRR